jgi:XcyI restriction endonuclease
MSIMTRFPILSPDLQISLYSRLQSLRKMYFREGLKATLEAADFDLKALDAELAAHAPPKHLKQLASGGLRGEIFFPVPYLLKRNPLMLGYYRLLFGFSQKAFYEQGPFSAFKSLEVSGQLGDSLEPVLLAFCESLIGTAALLLGAIDPVHVEIVHDLQVLTLGPQLRGSRNVDLGQAAVETMVDLLKGLLSAYSPIVERREITFTNDSSIVISIHFGGDPDIGVMAQLGSENRKLVAIEIKGGIDVSNIWNRLGEAEKSHRTARGEGYNELWTITSVDLESTREMLITAEKKSPSTTRFFFLPKIVDPTTQESLLFRQLLGSIIGAKLSL